MRGILGGKALAAAVVMFGALSGQPVMAQEQKMIPEELVQALLGMRTGSISTSIVVGQMPAGFPDLKLPANARVLGGQATGRTASVAILSFPGFAESARASVEQSLTTAGFTARVQEPRPEAFQRTGGGFQQNPRSFAPSIFCRSDASLTVSSWSQNGQQAFVRIDHTPVLAGRMSQCDARSQYDPTNVPRPTLTLPEGARSGSSGSGGSSDHREAYTQIETGATAVQLVDLFASQVRAAGWTEISRNNVPGVSVATFRLQKDGKEWLGLLTAIEFSGTAWRDVTMRVTAPRQ